jgi:hypothetical protein
MERNCLHLRYSESAATLLGEERTKRALKIFNLKYNIDKNITTADARFIKFAENLLTGHIGGFRQILISSVIKEDKISLTEVLKF